MRGGGNDLTGIPLFVSGLPKNCQYSLPEGDAQKYCLSLSLSEHEASELQNSNTESLNGFGFFLNKFIAKRNPRALSQIRNG